MQELNAIEQRIFSNISSGTEAEARSDVERIRAELNAMFAEINSYRAYARVQRSHADLMNAMGQDDGKIAVADDEEIVDPDRADGSRAINGLQGRLNSNASLDNAGPFTSEGSSALATAQKGGRHDHTLIQESDSLLYLTSTSDVHVCIPDEAVVWATGPGIGTLGHI